MCKIWEGGLVFYGGLFGGLAAAAIWVRIEKWPVSDGFDLVSPYILLGQAIGRMGCFLNGCCYGVEDDHYGLVFPGGEDNLPHLPTQLWELAGNLVLFFLLIKARKWTLPYRWLNFALYGFTYGLLRFVIEFWRLKRTSFLFNSVSQEVSGILVILSLGAIGFILYKGPIESPLRRNNG
jgi:phosphatidylglycerol:prolipoprotein diacylglycerol transferase